MEMQEKMSDTFDLLITSDRIVCPAMGLDCAGGVGITDGKIVAAGPEVSGSAKKVLTFSNSVLLPGLIDLHAHPSNKLSIYKIDPDKELLPFGTTTVLSQGDAGSSNWKEYCKATIEKSKCRVRLAINIAKFGSTTDSPAFVNQSDIDVEASVVAIEKAGDMIWGISADISAHNFGEGDLAPMQVLEKSVEVAEQTGLPILYGMRNTVDTPFEEQLAPLRAGDVITYCYRSEPHNIIENGRIHPAIRKARERGILFDIGHGKGSFDFTVAKAAMEDGFAPDTISTDKHIGHIGDTPRHDLPRMMSKLLAVGMPEADVFTAVTKKPSEIMRLSDEIGSLKAGTCADITVLTWNDNAEPLTDVYGNTVPGGCYEAVLTVRYGEIVEA